MSTETRFPYQAIQETVFLSQVKTYIRLTRKELQKLPEEEQAGLHPANAPYLAKDYATSLHEVGSPPL